MDDDQGEPASESQDREQHLQQGMFSRIAVGLVGSVALGYGTLWAFGVVEVLDPDFNLAGVPHGVVTWQAIVGFLGVAVLFLAGCCALAHAKTGERRWRSWGALSALCALPFYGVWIFLLFVAGSR